MDLFPSVEAHYTQLGTNVNHYRNRENYCDVTLLARGGYDSGEEYVIKAHKVILAAASEYFREIFERNEAMNIVDVSPAQSTALRDAVDYVYSGYCELNKDNVSAIYALSKQWKLQKLTEISIKIMNETVTVDNAIEYYNCSYTESEVIFSFMRRHFKDLYKLNKIKHLTMDAFQYMLCSRKPINVLNEDSILYALIQWLEANDTVTDVKCLFDSIRFDNLSDNCLKTSCENHAVMRTQQNVLFMQQSIFDVKSGKITRHSGGRCSFIKRQKADIQRNWYFLFN